MHPCSCAPRRTRCLLYVVLGGGRDGEGARYGEVRSRAEESPAFPTGAAVAAMAVPGPSF